MQEKLHLAILNSTSAGGLSALRLVEAFPERFQAEVISSGSHTDLLAEQAIKYNVNVAVTGDDGPYSELKDKLFDAGIKFYCGSNAVDQVLEMGTVQRVLNAESGIAGIRLSLKAIDSGKPLILSNADSLVAAGGAITESARRKGVNIYPADPVLGAIFQCIAGEFHNKPARIFIPYTPSGNSEGAADTKVALITAMRMIQAKWFFGLNMNQIQPVYHPEDVVKGMVQFSDGNLKMLAPSAAEENGLRFALGFPDRLPSDPCTENFTSFHTFRFEQPDQHALSLFALANRAVEKEGNAGCIFSAVSEVALELMNDIDLRSDDLATVLDGAFNSPVFICHAGAAAIENTYRDATEYARNEFGRILKRHYAH